jgi:hypothetical protein
LEYWGNCSLRGAFWQMVAGAVVVVPQNKKLLYEKRCLK